MTAEEIIKQLEIEVEENDTELGDYFTELEGTHEILGEIEEVDSKGGYEGGGEYAMRVMYFKNHDVYLKLEGVYYSYHGTDWDDSLQEVRPKEKTVTVYE